jgi:hypothetical protein
MSTRFSQINPNFVNSVRPTIPCVPSIMFFFFADYLRMQFSCFPFRISCWFSNTTHTHKHNLFPMLSLPANTYTFLFYIFKQEKLFTHEKAPSSLSFSHISKYCCSCGNWRKSIFSGQEQRVELSRLRAVLRNGAFVRRILELSVLYFPHETVLNYQLFSLKIVLSC